MRPTHFMGFFRRLLGGRTDGHSPPDLDHNDVGIAHFRRYQTTGALADLETAIAEFGRAVALTPANSRNLARCWSNFGNGISCRYGHTGALADLETAIACYEQAVLLAPADSPDLPQFLSNLFLALGNRYDHTGERADRDAAIAIYRRARALGHGVTPEVAMRATALGVGEP